MVLVVGRLTEDSAEEGAVSESEAGSVSDLNRNNYFSLLQTRETPSYLV